MLKKLFLFVNFLLIISCPLLCASYLLLALDGFIVAIFLLLGLFFFALLLADRILLSVLNGKSTMFTEAYRGVLENIATRRGIKTPMIYISEQSPRSIFLLSGLGQIKIVIGREVAERLSEQEMHQLLSWSLGVMQDLHPFLNTLTAFLYYLLSRPRDFLQRHVKEGWFSLASIFYFPFLPLKALASLWFEKNYSIIKESLKNTQFTSAATRSVFYKVQKMREHSWMYGPIDFFVILNPSETLFEESIFFGTKKIENLV